MPQDKIFVLQFCKQFLDIVDINSGVARGGKWGHAPWGAGLGGASAHFLQSFKNAFKAEI